MTRDALEKLRREGVLHFFKTAKPLVVKATPEELVDIFYFHREERLMMALVVDNRGIPGIETDTVTFMRND